MNLRLLRLAATCVLAFAGTVASAEPIFLVHNESALSRTTALPKIGQATVLDAKEFSTHFAIDWSNEYLRRQNASESLTIDGETGHFDWSLRYGVLPGVEIGIDVPVLLTGGGVLDNLIDGWHSAFNLNTGGRQQTSKNDYRYRYTRDGVTLLDVDHGNTRFGDVELNAGVAVTTALALRGLVKLPSGSESRLTGGNLGGALWLDFDPFENSDRWFGFLSGGVSYNDESRVLNQQQRQFVGFGGAGLGYRLFRRFALVSQFYAHSPLYKDTDIDSLKRPGGQLLFGARIGVAPHLSVDLGVEEDVIVNSSPDFGIHFGLNFH